MRLFVAIELPEAVRRSVAGYAEVARAALPERSVRWVRPENLHLTLLFLGDTDDDRVPAVAAALDGAGQRVRPAALEVAGSGRFTAACWVGVTGEVDLLATWVDAVHEALELRADRPFRPHVTIGRFRDPRRSRRLDLPPCGSLGGFEAREAVLFASELAPDGARYTAVHRSPFRG